MPPSGGADLPGLLARLEERLRRWGAPVAHALRPGLSADDVRSTLAGERLAAPDDVLAWWGWHDGVEGTAVAEGPGIYENPENELLAGWHVISLADAVRIRRWIRADYAEMNAPDVVPADWLPVLHYVGTPFLAADTAAGAASALYIVDGAAGLPERPPQPRFASLAELVSVLIRLFDEGLVTPSAVDRRVPSLLVTADDADVRRLTRW